MAKILAVLNTEYPENCFVCHLSYTWHNDTYMDEPEWQEICCLTDNEPDYDKCPLIPLDARHFIIDKNQDGRIKSIKYKDEVKQ